MKSIRYEHITYIPPHWTLALCDCASIQCMQATAYSRHPRSPDTRVSVGAVVFHESLDLLSPNPKQRTPATFITAECCRPEEIRPVHLKRIGSESLEWPSSRRRVAIVELKSRRAATTSPPTTPPPLHLARITTAGASHHPWHMALAAPSLPPS